MAVKVRNVRNAKKAKLWDEQDDAALLTLLRRKIRDVNIALRECETPYERTRLRKQRDHYKAMLGKVETGSYNGDIIFSELKASAALHQEQALSSRAHASVRGGKIYNKSYDPMDFDYEAAFRKKRYFGVALPIFMTVLSLLLIAVFVIGFFLPSEINDKIYDNTGLDLRTYVVYRLGETSDGNVIDLEIDNEGFETVAGLVLKLAGHIPNAGEFFKSPPLKLTVLQTEQHRISKVKIVKIPT